MDIPQEIKELVLSPQEFETLEHAIKTSKEDKKTPALPRKHKHAKDEEPSDQEVEMTLEIAKHAYENGDWSDAAELYSGLASLDDAVINGRLSVCLALTGDWEKAFDYANKAYMNYPAQAAPYVTLALCKELANQPDEGLRWLKLAAQADDLPSILYDQIKERLEEAVQTMAAEEKYAIPFLQTEGLLERIANHPEFSMFVDMDDFGEVLERVRADPTTLRFERGRCVPLNVFLKILNVDSDVLLPKTYSAEDVILMLQEDCPLHTLDEKLFRRIGQYLPLSAFGALHSTCKLTQYWASQPDTWKMIFLRQWEPLNPEKFGIDLMPYMWKYNFKNRHFITTVPKAIIGPLLTPRADLSDIEAIKKRTIKDLCKLYRVTEQESMANVMSEVVDLIASTNTSKNIISLLQSNAFIPVAVATLARFDGRNESSPETHAVLQALTALSLAAGPHVNQTLLRLGTKTLCNNLLGSQIHVAACALMGALSLGEAGVRISHQAVIPSPSWTANLPEEKVENLYQSLNGTWKIDMFYAAPHLKHIIEGGSANLEFDASTATMMGEGIDSIGAFKIADGAVIELKSGDVYWTQEYAKLKIEFEGVSNPFGFSGCFRMIPAKKPQKKVAKKSEEGEEEEEEEEQAEINGYWVSCPGKKATEDEWKVITAELKAVSAKRYNSRNPLPWEATPAPLALLEMDLRETTREAFTTSMPGTTYVKCVSAIAFLQDMPEEGLPDSAPLVKGAFETPEKYLLRTRIHHGLLARLYSLRLAFGVEKISEVTADLAALEEGDKSSQAILYKWHDYLCLYTFDNYSVSSGVEGLCQFFKAVLRYAEEIAEEDPEDMDREEEPEEEDMSDPAVRNKYLTLGSTERADEDDSVSQNSNDDEGSEDEDDPIAHVNKLYPRRKNRNIPSATSLLIAGSVIAVVAAGVFAFTRFFKKDSKR